MKLTGAAILVSRGMKFLQAAPAAYPYRSAAEGIGVSVAALQQALAVVRELPDRMDADPGIADEAIVQAVDRLNAQMQTNCVSWAEGMFAATAPLCRRRPHLASALLRHAYLSLVYIGHESFEDTRRFVGWLLEQPSTYMLPLSDDGRAWLAGEYHTLGASLQPVIAELVRHAQQDAEPGAAADGGGM